MSTISWFSLAYLILSFFSFLATFIKFRKSIVVSPLKFKIPSMIIPALLAVGVAFMDLGIEKPVVIALSIAGLFTGVLWKILKSKFTSTTSGFGRLYSFSFIHLITSTWFWFVFSENTEAHLYDQLPVIFSIFLVFLFLSSWIKIASTENSHNTFGDWTIPLLFLVFLMVMPQVKGNDEDLSVFVLTCSSIWVLWSIFQIIFVHGFEWLKDNKWLLTGFWLIAAGGFSASTFFGFKKDISFEISGLPLQYDAFYQIGIMAVVLFAAIISTIFVLKKLKIDENVSPSWDSLPLFIAIATGTFVSYILGAEFGLFIFGLSVSTIILPFQNVYTGRIIEKLIFFIVSFIVVILLKKNTMSDAFDFAKPQVMIGFVAGAVLLLWLKAIEDNTLEKTWKNAISSALFLLISVVVVTASGYLIFIHESLGGAVVLASIIAGVGLTLVLYPTSIRFEFSKLSWILVWALLIAPQIVLPDLYADTKSSRDKLELEGENNQGENIIQNKDLSEAKGNWVLDNEFTKLGFGIVSQGDVTKGIFKKLSGNLTVGDEIEKTQFNITIDAASVNTSNSIRDESLRNDKDFFETNLYPEIVYQSSQIEKTDTSYIAKGTLKMKNIEKQIDMPFKFLGKGTREDGTTFLLFEGGLQIDRSEFGMLPSSSISNQVDITFEAEFISK